MEGRSASPNLKKFSLTHLCNIPYATPMSKLFQEFQVATEDNCQFAWSGVPKGKAFFCAFCRHRFVPGDEYRAIYTNDLKGAGGNPLTCRQCFERHGGLGGLRTRWQELWKAWRELTSEGGKFSWWYTQFFLDIPL